jgi:hypothetical protein
VIPTHNVVNCLIVTDALGKYARVLCSSKLFYPSVMTWTKKLWRYVSQHNDADIIVLFATLSRRAIMLSEHILIVTLIVIILSDLMLNVIM